MRFSCTPLRSVVPANRQQSIWMADSQWCRHVGSVLGVQEQTRSAVSCLSDAINCLNRMSTETRVRMQRRLRRDVQVWSARQILTRFASPVTPSLYHLHAALLPLSLSSLSLLRALSVPPSLNISPTSVIPLARVPPTTINTAADLWRHLENPCDADTPRIPAASSTRSLLACELLGQKTELNFDDLQY